MPEVSAHSNGTFCWPELSTTDSAGAKEFYKSIFGWDLHDDEVGPGQVYTMASKSGKNVGAMYQQSPDQKAQGVPSHWLSYVSVDDVDKSLEKVQSLGGAAIMGPMDIMDIGRMAVLSDPTGAAFAMWQPKKHIGAEIVNEHGALCWNELWTNDESKANTFYTGLFNWASETADMNGMKYTSFKNGERPAAGMMEIKPEMGPVPPNWLVYFAIDDCDGSVEKINKLGGKTLHAPADIPGLGRFAVCMDPQHAAFAVIQLEMPAT